MPGTGRTPAAGRPDRRASTAVGVGDGAGAARGGADAETAALYAAYHARIRRYLLGMVHDPDEADDLTQDVFLQVHRRLGSLRDPDAVASWLYRIATHVAYDRFRQWSRRPRPDPLDSPEKAGRPAWERAVEEPSLGRVVEQAEMSACVRGYLDELSDDYRTAILLHDLEGLTNVEIAEMLGVSLDAVKIRLHRARRRLEAALAAHCDFTHDEQGVFVCEPGADPSTGSPAAAAMSGVYPSASPDRPERRVRHDEGAPGTGGTSRDDVVER